MADESPALKSYFDAELQQLLQLLQEHGNELHARIELQRPLLDSWQGEDTWFTHLALAMRVLDDDPRIQFAGRLGYVTPNGSFESPRARDPDSAASKLRLANGLEVENRPGLCDLVNLFGSAARLFQKLAANEVDEGERQPHCWGYIRPTKYRIC
jgi:hypothetical protein